ncbi:MAG: biotin--[acetyl-CoA-carboxylase] ligase [Burkholderia sp.]|nr:biotin--[acetyl-CoA-carboxylase] ligase [Burkholderia sp.]
MLLDDTSHISHRRLFLCLDIVPRSWPLEIVSITRSTNSDVIARLKALPHQINSISTPFIRVALEQSDGHGLHGRRWFAEPGSALLCSIGYIIRRPINALNGFSIAVGVALIEWLRTLPIDVHSRIVFKWSNDILLIRDESSTHVISGKLAGILIETAWTTLNATAVVIGFGINIHSITQRVRRAIIFEKGGLQPSALSSVYPDANITDSLSGSLNTLAPMLKCFEEYGFKPFKSRWKALNIYPEFSKSFSSKY